MKRIWMFPDLTVVEKSTFLSNISQIEVNSLLRTKGLDFQVIGLPKPKISTIPNGFKKKRFCSPFVTIVLVLIEIWF